jgi:hypothetical protein
MFYQIKMSGIAIGYIATIGPRIKVNKIEITEAIRTIE